MSEAVELEFAADGLPTKVRWNGLDYDVIDTPSRLELDAHFVTHPPPARIGWRFTGRSSKNDVRTFDVFATAHARGWVLIDPPAFGREIPDYSFEPRRLRGTSVRRMLPATRRPTEPPRWEVSTDGRVIGWIDRHRIGGASANFYFATGVHPATGTHYRLESSTDFVERVDVLQLFDIDPMTSRQHLGLGLMPAYRPSADPAR